MTQKTLQRHCADFILKHCRGEIHRRYRRECIEFWKGHYGENFASEVEAIIRKEWKDGKAKQKAPVSGDAQG